MSDILLLYLYYNTQTFGSFLTDKEKTDENLDFVSKIYVINPDIPVVPSGLNFLCLHNDESGNYTSDISEVGDPFNKDLNCLRILVWTEPAPYTSPLYVWKKGNSVLMTFGEEKYDGYTQIFFTPLYVLMDPRVNVKRIPYTGKTFEVVDNKPVFLFRNEYGFCIPDGSGKRLKDCLKEYTDKDQPNILTRIRQENKRVEGRFTFFFIFCLLLLSFLVSKQILVK